MWTNMLNGVFKIVPPSYPLTPPLGLVPLRYGIYNDFKPPFLSLLPIRKRNCLVAGPSTYADEFLLLVKMKTKPHL